MGQIRVPAALSALGVSPDSEQLYRAVLGNPGSSVEILADRVGRQPGEVRRMLAALVDAGLVSISDGTVRAEPPQLALGRLLAREARQLVAAEEALAHARLEVSRYEAEHQAGLLPGSQALGVEIVDPSKTRSVLNSLALSTVGEMLFLQTDQGHTAASRSTDAAVTGALRSGRTSRVLYPIDIPERPSSRYLARLAAGERARVLPRVPCRMAVFGDSAVVLPRSWEEPAVTAVVVRQPGIVSVCRAWFEDLWRQGVDVPGTRDERDAAARSRLLQLLEHGVKDEGIARTLGMSLRTVRRRIADLLTELGVESRFQAGAEAVRRGWL